MSPRQIVAPEIRFWAKVDKSGDCWVWTAAINKGYGVFAMSKTDIRDAHRVSWEWANGPVPVGLELDHLCRNPACVRPSHLEAVIHLENVRRGRAPAALAYMAGTCMRGHPRTPENSWRNGSRLTCKPCRQAWIRSRAA